ncbi:pantoate--beta-alanine ligase [Alteromonas lipotrueiana]|uniref:pantoate--beta-alanine ligase n=1 Tax=Alteromonas lipotrueiana TaxID=2803815 RepID=UPI001C454199|nr:pantoate--beta-alanine ligase [Alteromonas lipotrueiana]
MNTVESINELRTLRRQWHREGKTVGFVPTMGNLHAGHLTLISAAREQCDIVVASIFVNPLQFGKNEDLDTYPRTIDEDKAQLDRHHTDVLFLPSVAEMYPRGLDEQTFVQVPGISDMICGNSRPGHFRGVATVVSKLFNMVQPDRAFFGQKDYQQLQVIRLMAADLSIDIDIQGIPTQRAEDGLALSSRNGYLTEEQRQIAPKLYACLLNLKTDLQNDRQPLSVLIEKYTAVLAQAGFKPDYIEIRHADTLEPVGDMDNQLVVLVAAFLGNVRLIDNLTVTRPEA